jgi:PEGA domain
VLLLWSMAMAQELQVSSNVEGAPIFIDGSDTGERTPATLTNLTPGRVTVTVGDGCGSSEAEVTLTEGKVSKVNVSIVERKGSLLLNMNPAESLVFLDGDPLPATSGVAVEVECGTHSLRVESEGFSPFKGLVTIDSPDTVTMPITLRTLGQGTLVVSGSPKTADIYLDGKMRGSGSVTLEGVIEGVHVMSARENGYQEVEQAVMVGPNETLTYQIKLSPTNSSKPSSVVPQGKTSEKAAEVGARAYASGARPPGKTAAPAGEPQDSAAEEEEAEESAAEEERLAEEARREEEEQAAREESSRRESERREAERREAERRKPEERDREEDPELVDEPSPEDDPNDMELDVVALDEDGNPVDGPREDDDVPSDLDEPGEKEKKSKPPQFWAGIGMLGVGVAGGGTSVYLYDAALRDYKRYEAAALAAQDDDSLQGKANYFEKKYKGSRNLFYGTVAGAGLLLIGGTVCVLVDDGASVTLIPGGAMFSFHREF